MKTVIGEYDRDGYQIMTADGKVLHSAGANAVDSHAPGRDVSLATIRHWCNKTGREIAAERGAAWGGAERKEPEGGSGHRKRKGAADRTAGTRQSAGLEGETP